MGYKHYFKVTNLLSARKNSGFDREKKGPIFIEVIIKQGSLSSLERPKSLKLIKEIYKMINLDSNFSKKTDIKIFLEKEKFKKVFIITGKNSYYKSGAKKIFDNFLANKKDYILF